MHNPIIFHLELGGEIIAVIETYMYEFPWLHGTIIQSNNFERYKPYFLEDDSEESDALYDEIKSKGDFLLVNTQTNEREDKVLLNVGSDSVWFRF